MPKIKITEIDNTGVASLSSIPNVVYIPGKASGTTAVACINTNRNYIGFEIEEKYCKIANIRINELNNEIKLF